MATQQAQQENHRNFTAAQSFPTVSVLSLTAAKWLQHVEVTEEMTLPVSRRRGPER